MSFPEQAADNFNEFLKGFHAYFPAEESAEKMGDRKIDTVALGRFLANNQQFLSLRHNYKAISQEGLEQVIRVFDKVRPKDKEHVPLDDVRLLLAHSQTPGTMQSIAHAGSDSPLFKVIVGFLDKKTLRAMAQTAIQWSRLSRVEQIERINSNPAVPLWAFGIRTAAALLEYVTVNGRELTCLNLEGITAETLKASELREVIANCPNITFFSEDRQELDFPDENNEKLRDHWLRNDTVVLLSSRPLRHLSLRNCTMITDAAFEALPIRTLTSLNLSGCIELTDAVLPHLQRLPLIDLNLTGCNQITVQALDDLYRDVCERHLVMQERVLTKEEADSIPIDRLRMLNSDIGVSMLRNKLIKPSDAVLIEPATLKLLLEKGYDALKSGKLKISDATRMSVNDLEKFLEPPV